MTKHIGQNLLILLLALLTLGLTFLLILDLIPADASGLEVKEQADASSALVQAGGNIYTSSLRGTLKNTTDNNLEVDKITVVVSNKDGQSKTLEFQEITVLPHADLDLSYQWESSVSYDRVTSITVFVDGEEDLIPNAERTFFLRASTIVYGVLVAIAAFFLVWVCKVRYYMYQEDTEKYAENKN